jgi:hypothetical protein
MFVHIRCRPEAKEMHTALRSLGSRVVITLTTLAVLAACDDPTPGSLLGPTRASMALATGASTTRYKLQFASPINPAGDGELQSGWFPDTGVTLNTRAPWKSLTVGGATISLVNFTHGKWTAGTCATFTTSKSINITNWDIAGTNPVLSFAGMWFGTVSTSQTTGTSVYFDGDRMVNDVVTPSAGGIHNVASNGNQAYESKDPTGNNDWFQLEIRNAFMKFGSASSPDGVDNPLGVEVACANFTLMAKKASLITQ